jgi:hypothetical protein
MKHLKNLDYYSIKPSLILGKKDSYKSPCGGAVSALIFMVIAYIFYDFSKNMIGKLNPQIKSSLNFHEEEPSVDLKDFNMALFLYNREQNRYINDSTIAYFEARIITNFAREDGAIDEKDYELDLEPCNLSNIPYSYLHEGLKRNGFRLSTCIKKEQKHEERIQGGWGEVEFDYLSIELKRCRGVSPEGLPCQRNEDIEYTMRNSIVGVNVLDSILHLENYKEPLKKVIKSIHTFTSNSIHKEYNVELSIGVVETDAGILFSQSKEESFLKVTGERELTKLVNEVESGAIASFNFVMTNVEYRYSRQYDKLQDVLAQAGLNCLN